MSNPGYDDDQYADEHYDEGQYDTGYYGGSVQHDADNQTSNSADYSAIPDVLQLNHFCASAIAPRSLEEEDLFEADESWEPVREWLRSHNADEVRQAAEQRGESSMTALHFACRNQPPLDIINVFLSIAIETVQWPDTFGWLPIHYACASGADTQVIQILAEAYPESKTTVDRRGRTPLHFALGNQNQLAEPAAVAILSSTGATSYADDNGMLPLHYACAYGASEESLYVLTDTYREAISTRDSAQRTPLHFALSNAGRKASPGAVRHLLDLDNNLANSNNGPLPLRVLAEFWRRGNTDADRESVKKCLIFLLNANPDPTADFFTALQSLPGWLSEQAVVMPSVQILLNDKISQRVPTFFLLGDLYFQIMVMVFFAINIFESIRLRAGPDNVSVAIQFIELGPLYLGAIYFIVRELLQAISLFALKSFHTWLYDWSNWLKVIYIFFILYWAIVMQQGLLEDKEEAFRTVSALTIAIFAVKFLDFLRNFLFAFAVFAGGVSFVFRQLVAFLTALLVILIGFAQMFQTVFRGTAYCTDVPDRQQWEKVCEIDDDRPYCSFWTSFLNVYTMLLGEVDESQFESSSFATALFIVFMFLCVILLANVLIAIVTESYKVIQDQRAAIVFWSNRLDFVAEMDAIANGPWKDTIRKAFGLGGPVNRSGKNEVVFGKDFWKRLMDLFEDDIEAPMSSLEFWAYYLLRALTVLVIIPLWIIIGSVSLGWLFPPQIREFLFASAVAKHSSESERQGELRKTQVAELQAEVADLKEEINKELKVDRTHVVQIKSLIADRRAEIANEMKHIKRIMSMLFEQQSSYEG